jgi:predicted restriction endonuclease
MKKVSSRKEESRRYYEAHRKEKLAHQLKYAKKHRKENNERERKRREEHPIRHARLKREEYQRNREKRLAAVKEHDRKHRLEKAWASREWRKRHPRKAKALRLKGKHIRRARLTDAKGFFTFQEFRRLCKKYGYRCLCCGKTEKQLCRSQKILVPDHVKPISRGGSNEISNIQPLCHAVAGGRGGCNNAKHTQEVDYRGKKQYGDSIRDGGCPTK